VLACISFPHNIHEWTAVTLSKFRFAYTRNCFKCKNSDFGPRSSLTVCDGRWLGSWNSIYELRYRCSVYTVSKWNSLTKSWLSLKMKVIFNLKSKMCRNMRKRDDSFCMLPVASYITSLICTDAWSGFGISWKAVARSSFQRQCMPQTLVTCNTGIRVASVISICLVFGQLCDVINVLPL
jgi:hypothetical protein